MPSAGLPRLNPALPLSEIYGLSPNPPKLDYGLWTNLNCHGAAASDPWGRPEGWASDMGNSW